MESILKFEPNRVLRLYRGGSGIDRLCGRPEAEDTRYPENWIASCIEGNGRAYHSPGHGIGKVTVEGVTHSFPEFLKENAEAVLGKAHVERFGPIPGVLVKLLDSAEQLPLQVHPTREDAVRYFHSPFGKTEAWIVLSTREVAGEEPYLLIGFNGKLDEAVFRRESLAGKYATGLAMLHKVHVAPGDVVVISGGLPHAIGPGVTMVEVMEPSDLVIVPEINCCGIQLNEKQRFAGLSPETALELFDWRTFTEDEIRRYCSPEPELIWDRPEGRFSALIPPSRCDCFSAWKLEFNGSFDFDGFRPSFGIGILTQGKVNINGTAFRPGESFLIPHSCQECRISGRGEIILLLPPSA